MLQKAKPERESKVQIPLPSSHPLGQSFLVSPWADGDQPFSLHLYPAQGVEPASVFDRHLPPQSHSSPPVDRPTGRPQHAHSDSMTLGRSTRLTGPALPYWQHSPCRWGKDLRGITEGFFYRKESPFPLGKGIIWPGGLWIVQERSTEELKGLDGQK